MTEKTGETRGRKEEHDEATQRLLKKRTLILGEVDSSSDEMDDSESFGSKLDRMFPGWWEEDQHVAECRCDFCLFYHGHSPAHSDGEPPLSSALSPAGQPEQAAAPPSPVAA